MQANINKRLRRMSRSRRSKSSVLDRGKAFPDDKGSRRAASPTCSYYGDVHLTIICDKRASPAHTPAAGVTPRQPPEEATMAELHDMEMSWSDSGWMDPAPTPMEPATPAPPPAPAPSPAARMGAAVAKVVRKAKSAVKKAKKAVKKTAAKAKKRSAKRTVKRTARKATRAKKRVVWKVRRTVKKAARKAKRTAKKRR
jgi:hypothetical protein